MRLNVINYVKLCFVIYDQTFPDFLINLLKNAATYQLITKSPSTQNNSINKQLVTSNVMFKIVLPTTGRHDD